MQTEDPGAVMPELGRAVIHDEGVALISEWIESLSGDCQFWTPGSGAQLCGQSFGLRVHGLQAPQQVLAG